MTHTTKLILMAATNFAGFQLNPMYRASHTCGDRKLWPTIYFVFLFGSTGEKGA